MLQVTTNFRLKRRTRAYFFASQPQCCCYFDIPILWPLWRISRSKIQIVPIFNMGADIMFYFTTSWLTTKKAVLDRTAFFHLVFRKINLTSNVWSAMLFYHYLELLIRVKLRSQPWCVLSMHNINLHNSNQCHPCKKDSNTISAVMCAFSVWSIAKLLTAVKQNWKFLKIISSSATFDSWILSLVMNFRIPSLRISPTFANLDFKSYEIVRLRSDLLM